MFPTLCGLSDLSGKLHILKEISMGYGGHGKRAAHEYQEMPLACRRPKQEQVKETWLL
jgi:phosphoribosylaminoimidazole carboxylase (NCAIR synthetase)